MVGTTRSRVNFFMNKFRKLGLIEYNGGLKVNSSLLSIVLHELIAASRGGHELDLDGRCRLRPPCNLEQRARLPVLHSSHVLPDYEDAAFHFWAIVVLLAALAIGITSVPNLVLWPAWPSAAFCGCERFLARAGTDDLRKHPELAARDPDAMPHVNRLSPLGRVWRPWRRGFRTAGIERMCR